MPYSIKNIINYRNINWDHSEDFLFLTDIPSSFEPFILTPDYFSYGIISQGQLIVELDDELLQVDNKSQSFFVYRPHQNLKIIEISPGTQGAFVLFNKKFIQTFDNDYLSITDKTFLENRYGTYFNLSEGDYTRIKKLFTKIFDLLSFIQPDLWNRTAKSLMLVLISETDLVLSKYAPSDQRITLNRGQQLLEKFSLLVNENYLAEHNLDFYAQELNISANYLHKIVQTFLNTTPGTLIQNAVLEHSLLLLETSDSNISEIADKLSFNDVYSFSKFFKKKMQVSPTKYREQLLSEIVFTESGK